MIKDAVVHIVGDQPMLCDLDTMPKPADMSLVCTNLRTVDGKKPISIDHTDSWFVLPLQFVRFIEIPRRSMSAADRPAAPVGAPGSATGEEELPAAELPSWLAEPPAAAPEEPPEPEDLEPDLDLLRRIREV